MARIVSHACGQRIQHLLLGAHDLRVAFGGWRVQATVADQGATLGGIHKR